MHKRLTAYFSGTVQGVGFRFTAERIARGMEVTGTVRNLQDGRVELVAEGEEKVLEKLLKTIVDSSMGDYIRDVDAAWSVSTGVFQAFRVVP